MSDLVLAILSQTSGRASQALRASSAELPAFGEALRQAQRAERPAAREAAAAPQEAAPAREVDVQDAAADAPVEDQPTRDQPADAEVVTEGPAEEPEAVDEEEDADTEDALAVADVVASVATTQNSPAPTNGDAASQAQMAGESKTTNPVKPANAEPAIPVAVIGEKQSSPQRAASDAAAPAAVGAAAEASRLAGSTTQQDAGEGEADADAKHPRQGQVQSQLQTPGANNDSKQQSPGLSSSPPLQMSSESSAGPRTGAVVPPGTAQAPAAPEADANAMNAARIARGLQSALAQQGGSVTLRLTPPELGTVRIQLQLQGGQISANFQSGNESARAMLTQQLAQLRTSLEGQGFHVDRLTVQQTPSTPGAHLQQQSSQQGQQQHASSQNPTHHQSATDGRSRGDFGQNQQNSDGRQARQQPGRNFTDWFDSQQTPSAA